MEPTPPPFFNRGPAPLVRLTFFATLAVFLMVLDARFRYAVRLFINVVEGRTISGRITDMSVKEARAKDAPEKAPILATVVFPVPGFPMNTL